MNSKYVLQKMEKSHCPKCLKLVWLLVYDERPVGTPSFFICFECRQIWQVGVGPVVKTEPEVEKANAPLPEQGVGLKPIVGSLVQSGTENSPAN